MNIKMKKKKIHDKKLCDVDGKIMFNFWVLFIFLKILMKSKDDYEIDGNSLLQMNSLSCWWACWCF